MATQTTQPKTPKKRSSVLRVFSYVRRYPALAAGNLLCAIGGTVAVIVFPSVTKQVVDGAIIGKHPEQLLPLALIGLGAFFLQEAAQRPAHPAQQRLRAKGHLRSAQRPLLAHPAPAAGLVRQPRHRRPDDPHPRGRQQRRARPDRRHRTGRHRRAPDRRGRGDALRLRADAHARRALARAVARGGRADLHAHRLQTLQAAAHRRVGHELAAARQPRGHPPDQDLRARGRGTPPLQRA